MTNPLQRNGEPMWPDGTDGPKNIGVGVEGRHPSITVTVPVYPASYVQELLDGFRYIDGQDVAGYEAHMTPREVARRQLAHFNKTGEKG